MMGDIGKHMDDTRRKELEPASDSPGNYGQHVPILQPPNWVTCVHTDLSFLQNLYP